MGAKRPKSLVYNKALCPYIYLFKYMFFVAIPSVGKGGDIDYPAFSCTF